MKTLAITSLWKKILTIIFVLFNVLFLIFNLKLISLIKMSIKPEKVFGRNYVDFFYYLRDDCHYYIGIVTIILILVSFFTNLKILHKISFVIFAIVNLVIYSSLDLNPI